MSDYATTLLEKSSPTYAAAKTIGLPRAWCVIWELVDRIAELEAKNKRMGLDLQSADIAVHKAAIALELADVTIADLRALAKQT